MKPIIVGVDPGSTSAVAAVDLKGEIQLLESGKNFPPREIIQRIIKVGKPVVVASDKGKTPSKVDDIASSVGAKLFEPENDLSSEKKKELGKGANSHELDAVASAVHAKKQLHRDIRKIEKYDSEKELDRVEVAEKIFNDRQLKEETEKPVEETNRASSIAESSEDKDREKKRLNRKIQNLEAQIRELKSELGEKESRIDELEDALERRDQEDRKEVVKDEEVKKREAVIRDKNRRIEELESEIEKHSLREIQYRKALEKIKKEDYKVVPIVDDDLAEIPEEALTRDNKVKEELKNRGVNIHLVEDVEAIELGRYAAVKEMPENHDFESIIQEYKEKR